MDASTSPLIWWVTIAWLLMSFHGGLLTALALRDSRQDAAWLHAAGLNGARTIIARAAIRNDGSRLFFFATLFAVGINALIGRHGPYLVVREAITTALVVLVLAAMAAVATLDARDRTSLLTIVKIERARQGDAAARAVAP